MSKNTRNTGAEETKNQRAICPTTLNHLLDMLPCPLKNPNKADSPEEDPAAPDFASLKVEKS